MRIILPASRIVNQGNVAAWTSAEAEVDDDELAPFAALTAVALSPMDRRVVLRVRDDGVCEAVGARTRDAHRQALEARLLTSQAPLLAARPKAAMIPLPVLRAHPARVDRAREELLVERARVTAPSDRTAARYEQPSLRCAEAQARCSEPQHCSGHGHRRSDVLHQHPVSCTNTPVSCTNTPVSWKNDTVTCNGSTTSCTVARANATQRSGDVHNTTPTRNAAAMSCTTPPRDLKHATWPGAPLLP